MSTDTTQAPREATLSLDIRAVDGSTAGSVELPAAVFGAQTNIPLIHQVVVAQLAAARQGTHSTKTRGEVSGGGKKPYRQKGTGRARQGSTRAPQFTGGGVVHGPRPRDYEQRTPKKMKAAALRGALSDRARHGRIHVVTELGIDGVPSTKAASKVLADIATRRNLLLVVSRTEQATQKSVRNIPDLHVLWPDQLNPYDVLCSDEIVFTRTALDEFVARASLGVSRGRAGAVRLPRSVQPVSAPVGTTPQVPADAAVPAQEETS